MGRNLGLVRMTVRIVVVGSFNADLTAYVARVPGPGETVWGWGFATGPGGKGSNQAVAASRLGAEVSFVGRIGQDQFAAVALSLWKQEGVRADFVVQDPKHATGIASILVDERGENRIVVVPGANLALSKGDVDAAEAVIAQADVLLTQLEIEDSVVEHALRMAKAKGVRTVLNPAPARPLSAEILQLVDYLTPNETELQALGHASGKSTEAAARSILVSNTQAVVATLGAEGAHCVRRREAARVPGYSVEVADTTGAGDAFNGALAVALAEGKTLPESVAFANAAAALCVTRPGAASSMPRRDEVEALLAA